MFAAHAAPAVGFRLVAERIARTPVPSSVRTFRSAGRWYVESPAVMFTIGYERASFAAVASMLAEAGVGVLVDVRAQPHSRRREFAFKHLGPGLAGYGIRYESWPVLGTPDAGREAAKRGDFETFHRVFETHLATDEVRAALEQLVVLCRDESVCLMCYEREPTRCHRLLIGERLTREHGVEVRDLFPPVGT